MERKCKKEESAQRGVWGEVPETTHALKERDSRKDRVGKVGGGEGDPGKGKKKGRPFEGNPAEHRVQLHIPVEMSSRATLEERAIHVFSSSLSLLSGLGTRAGRGSNPGQKGLRMRNSPMCTLSQNGYGECLWASGRLDPPDPLGSARSRCRCQGARSTRGGAGLTEQQEEEPPVPARRCPGFEAQADLTFIVFLLESLPAR